MTKRAAEKSQNQSQNWVTSVGAALLLALLLALTLSSCGGNTGDSSGSGVAIPESDPEPAPPVEEERAALRSQTAFVDEFNKQLVAQGVPVGDGLPYPSPPLAGSEWRAELELEADNGDTAPVGYWLYTDIRIYINIDEKTGEDLITGIDLDADSDSVREITKAAIVAFSEGMTLEEADQIVTKTKADQGYAISENRGYNLKYKGYYYSFSRGYFSIVTEPYDLATFEFYDVEGNDGKEIVVQTSTARDDIVTKLLPPGIEYEAGSEVAYFATTPMDFTDIVKWYDSNLAAVGFEDNSPEELALMNDPEKLVMMLGTISGETVSILLEGPQGVTQQGEYLSRISILFE